MNTFGRTAVVWSAFALMVALATPAAAQNAPTVDVGIGYQYLRIFDEGEDVNFPLGFNIDVSGAITNQISIVGEVGWSRDNDVFGIEGLEGTATTFGGGVRWTGRYNPTFSPYAQVILGGERDKLDFEGDDESETNFLLQPGAGVNVMVGPNWGVFGQVDYRRIFTEDEGTNAFRFVLGARFNIR